MSEIVTEKLAPSVGSNQPQLGFLFSALPTEQSGQATEIMKHIFYPITLLQNLICKIIVGELTVCPYFWLTSGITQEKKTCYKSYQRFCYVTLFFYVLFYRSD